MECVAISLYRQEYRRSPTTNFGRVLPGSQKSTANNARLVSQERRLEVPVAAQRPFIEPKSLTANARADLLPGMFLIAALQGPKEWWAPRDHLIEKPLNKAFRK